MPSNCSARSMIRSCTTMSLSAASSKGKRGMTRCESTRNGSLRSGSTSSANSSAVGTSSGSTAWAAAMVSGGSSPRARHQPSSSHCACSALLSTLIASGRHMPATRPQFPSSRCVHTLPAIPDGSEACHIGAKENPVDPGCRRPATLPIEPGGEPIWSHALRPEGIWAGRRRSRLEPILPKFRCGDHGHGHARRRTNRRAAAETPDLQTPPTNQACHGVRHHRAGRHRVVRRDL